MTEQKIVLELPTLREVGIVFYGNFVRGIAVGCCIGFFAGIALVAVAVQVLKAL